MPEGAKRGPRRGGRGGRGREPSLVAALDLGTNNCRLLIATASRGGQLRVVDSFSRIVRLGEGVAATGLLYLAILTAFGTDLVARAVLRP